LIPSEKVHEKLFVGANKTYKPFNYALRNRQQHNKPLTTEKLSEKHAKLLKDEQLKREKLKNAGIDYDFPGYVSILSFQMDCYFE
jgi:nucleolar protein 15